MKRIDSHQHFWQYDPVAYDWINGDMQILQRDFLPSHVQPKVKAARMDGCVAVQARQSLEENDFLLALANQYEEVVGVVGWLDLRSDQLEHTLEKYGSQEYFKGVRHIVQGEPDPEFIIRPDFVRGVRQLAGSGLAYDILVFEQQFPAVLRFLDMCPDQPFVLDHLGKPNMEKGPSKEWVAGIREMAQHPQLYCKVSGMVTEADWATWQPDDFTPYLDVVFDAFGSDRIMFGSDWPVCLLAADSYGEVVSIIDQYTTVFDESQKKAVYGGNAERFYKL